MKAIFRILGTAAAVAATGAAIVIMDKFLNEKAAPIIESIEFPEDAEKDDAEAAKTAEAYAEGEAKAEAEAAAPAEEASPAEDACRTETEAEAEEPAAPCQPGARNARSVTPRPRTRTPWRPAPPSPPRTKAANSTPPRLLRLSDFGDWEEQGCKG